MYPYMSKPIDDKNITIPENALRSLLTPSEIRMLKNRWQILNLLDTNSTIREIAEEIGVGTDTVIRVAKMFNKTGFERRNIKTSQKNSIKNRWIFGKSD